MDNDGILYKGALNGGNGTIQLSFAHGIGNANKLNFRLNGITSGAGQLASNTYIPDNQWTFIACTYNGTQQQIYINGSLDCSANYSSALQSDTNPSSPTSRSEEHTSELQS